VIREFGRRLHVSSEYLATGVASEEAGEAPILQAEVALRLGDTEEAARVFRAFGCRSGAASGSSGSRSGPDRVSSGSVGQAIPAARARGRAERRRLLRDPGAVESLARAHAATGALESAIALLEDACEQPAKRARRSR